MKRTSSAVEITGTNKIEVTREWLNRLIQLVDKVATETDQQEIHGWTSHLLGYVHSLDEHMK